jgi:hypothetical protein
MRPHAWNRDLKLTDNLQTITSGVSCAGFTCRGPTFIVIASSGGLADEDAGGTTNFNGGS